MAGGWARILAPVAGGADDAAVLDAACRLAATFEAEVTVVFAPADPAELTPWMGEGILGGVQVAAIDSLKAAAAEGERRARAEVEALAYPRKRFTALDSPVWSCLCMEARLTDVVVFGPEAARGRGPLAEAFQQVLMEERRPVFVARGSPDPAKTVAVAWDGGREASRAARAAVPWLRKAGRVLVLAAPQATPRHYDPRRLIDFLAEKGVRAELETRRQPGEPAPILLDAVKALGAELLVAGAFGHPRFQQFMFGGTTKALMQAPWPSLFLSH